MIRKLLCLTILSMSLSFAESVYELRTYTTPEGKLDALIARFRDHTVRIFKKHNMESVGYWVPQGPEHANTLIYLLKHPSREAAEKNWMDFQNDPEWKKVAADSGLTGIKVERVWLTPTAFSMLK
jgi:hypothetical protein